MLKSQKKLSEHMKYKKEFAQFFTFKDEHRHCKKNKNEKSES